MRTAALVLVIATFVGCTRQTTPSLPVPLAPSGPVSPDGSYDGMMQTVRGGELCGTGDSMSVAVRSRRFRYTLSQPQVPEQSTRVFEVTIGPDGSFNAQNGPAFMRGTVQGGHMQGEISGDACGFAFEADRTGTW